MSMTRCSPRRWRRLKQMPRLLVIVLAVFAAGCADPQIVYPDTAAYERRVRSFAVTPDEAQRAAGKSNGPSAVTARGKVRFVGFGAEGTCQELSFLSGTGEVSMTGAVKIQVKDKLGRVESELSTDSMKYRIDPSVINGSLKP